MRKFTESLSNIRKVEGETLTYFDLFPLLKGLESERPGIKDRVWKWMCKESDVTFKPYNGRIININLFYYGIGDEYPCKYLIDYPDELEHCKNTHPDAFKDGIEKELRLDLNLIWSVYQDDVDEEAMEEFPVITRW